MNISKNALSLSLSTLNFLNFLCEENFSLRFNWNSYKQTLLTYASAL